jgi:two-component system, sensor histidine kinase LadS
MQVILRFLGVCFLGISSFESFGQNDPPIYQIDINSEIISIGNRLQVFMDSTNSLKAEDISSNANGMIFSELENNQNTFPHLEYPLWFRFKIINSTTSNIYLEIGEPSVNFIDVYKIQNTKITKINSGGYFSPYHNRDIKTNKYLFNLNLNKSDTGYYFMRVDMRYVETITIPISAGTLRAFLERNHRFDLLTGIFYGAVLMVLIFNWIIYFTIWDRSYLYFSIHTALAALWVAHYYGHAFEFLWGHYPELNRLFPALTAASSIFVILFSRIFLKTKEYAPILHKGLYALLAAFSSTIILNVLDYYFHALMIVEIGAFFMCIYLTCVAIFVYRQGYAPAMVYIVALLSFFVGIIIFLGQINGLFEPNFLTRNAVPIGLGMEIGLISFAQGNRLRFYRLEKKKAQADLIASLKQNEQLLLEKTVLLEKQIEQQNIIENMRGRISQDIHDDVSSGLTKISWLAASLKPGISSYGLTEPIVTIDKIISQSRDVISKFGEIIWAVNPKHDNLESLLVYMRNYIVDFLEDSGFSCRIDFPEEMQNIKLSPELKRNLFLILKETLNNSVKYSKGDCISVSFASRNNKYQITISDNGQGFDKNKINGLGNGLINMEKRMNAVGGDFEIQSDPGQGTRILLKGVFQS